MPQLAEIVASFAFRQNSILRSVCGVQLAKRENQTELRFLVELGVYLHMTMLLVITTIPSLLMNSYEEHILDPSIHTITHFLK